MKYVKMLGLAAVAAMALMAFVGAGTASATALCQTTPTTSGTNIGECAEAWDLASGSTIDASLEGSAILETLGGTTLDTCTTGTVKGHTTNTGSTTETVDGPIDELTWGTVGTPCSKTTDTLANGSLEIHADGDTHNGIITGSGAEVTVSTIFGSCVYGTGANKNLGTLKGGSPATLEISTNVPKISGNATCPAETRWTANYKVTTPSSLWVGTGVY